MMTSTKAVGSEQTANREQRELPAIQPPPPHTAPSTLIARTPGAEKTPSPQGPADAKSPGDGSEQLQRPADPGRLPWKLPQGHWSVARVIGVAIDLPLWAASNAMYLLAKGISAAGIGTANFISKTAERAGLPLTGGLASVAVSSTTNLLLRTMNSVGIHTEISGVAINFGSGHGFGGLAAGIATSAFKAPLLIGRDLLVNSALLMKDLAVGSFRVFRANIGQRSHIDEQIPKPRSSS